MVDDDRPCAGLGLKEAPRSPDGLQDYSGHASTGTRAGGVDGVHPLARGAGQLEVNRANSLKKEERK